MNPPPRSTAQTRQGLDQLYLADEARKIVEIAHDDRAPVKRFIEAIGADPVFAARLLRLAHFAPASSQRLSAVPQLINAWGLDNVKGLALGLSAFALPETAPSETARPLVGAGPELRELWEHAVGTAAIAGRFAAQARTVSAWTAFTAGFVHDIGKVFLHRYSRENYAQALSVAREKAIPSTEAETLALGLDHVEAGSEWSKRTELSFALDRVLRFHHERTASLPAAMDDGSKRLIAIVRAADWACEAEAIGNGGDGCSMPRDLWEEAGLRQEDWREPLRALKGEVEAARPAYGLAWDESDKPQPARRPLLAAEETPGVAGQKNAANDPRGVVIPFPIRAEEAAQNSAKRAPGKLAILVVEDHSSLCDLLSLYFMRHGYHVRTASDGESALEVLSRETIHLVLLDLMLPRVDGFEVLRQIHLTYRDRTPYIIVVSAGASERDRQKVLDLGANEYMPKPFHLLRLLERVQTVEKFLL